MKRKRAESRPAGPSDGAGIKTDLADLLPGYLAARQREIPELRALLAERNLDGIRRIAHRLKGTGGTYGVAELTRLGDHIESAAQAGDEEAIRELLDQLAVALDRASEQCRDEDII